MPEIDLTIPEEIRFIATDAGALHEFLARVNMLPDDARRIASAICDRGVTSEQMFGLIWNAAVRMIAHTTAQYTRTVPCDLAPSCYQALGHSSDCDPDDPEEVYF